jgi:hypothetical protein
MIFEKHLLISINTKLGKLHGNTIVRTLARKKLVNLMSPNKVKIRINIFKLLSKLLSDFGIQVLSVTHRVLHNGSVLFALKVQVIVFRIM